jgi:TPP-dependent trihydroxycyclohexane-1,2-dione (THcHDO) dehydratase
MTARAPSAWQVQQIVTLAREVLQALREDHGQILEDDDEVIEALTGEGVGVDAALSSLGRAVLEAKAWAEATEARIDDLQARRDRAVRRHEILRETLLAAMQTLGLTSHKDVEFTAGVLHTRPKVIITAAGKLPDVLVTVETVRTPDKAAILKILQGDSTDPLYATVASAATLANPAPYLTLKAK